MDDVTWQDNYKSMTAEQLSAAYQQLLSNHKRNDKELGDKLKFIKSEFAIKIRLGK